MPFSRLVLAVAAALFCVIGHETVGQEATGTVIVTVLEADTRQPIEGALVTALNHDYRPKTGPDGRTRLDGLEPGPRWISVRAPHHISQFTPRDQFGQFGRILPVPDIPPAVWAARNPTEPGVRPVTVRRDGETHVEFLLPRAGVLAGQVFSPEGRPLANAALDVLELYSTSDESRTFFTVASAKTDLKGRFHATGLAPSDYYLCVSTGGGRPDAPVPVFYPGETSPLKAVAIGLQQGETKEVQIIAPTVRPVRMSGVVLDSTGRPVKGETRYVDGLPRSSVDLAYRRLDDPCCSDAISYWVLEVDPFGRFRTEPLPPGKYLFRSGKQAIPIVLESTAVEDLVVMLHDPVSVTGRVAPRPGWGREEEDPLSVALEPAEHFVAGGSAHPSQDGSFALNVPPGRYRIDIRAPNGWIVDYVRLGDGRDVTDEEIELRPGRAVLDVTIGLTTEVAVVGGRVLPLDAHGSRGFKIIAFPASRQHWHQRCRLWRTTSTDENGTFVLENVVPGADYLLAAVSWGARRPPIALERWLGDLSESATRVPVPEPGTYDATIDVDRPK